MEETILNEERIEAGEELLSQPDDVTVTVDAALWLYDAGAENQKLLLSLPDVIRQGPRAAYRQIQKGLARIRNGLDLSMNDVVVARPQDQTLQLLRRVVRTGPGIKRIRFTGNVVNGQVIQDTVTYRI